VKENFASRTAQVEVWKVKSIEQTELLYLKGNVSAFEGPHVLGHSRPARHMQWQTSIATRAPGKQ
jgi:hypothetical protein